MSILCLVLLLLTFSTGCEKGFEELNQDPNRSTQADPDALFAFAVHKYHTDYSNGVLTDIWGLNNWMQIQANINGISSINDAYFISGDALNNTWRLMYADVLGNLTQAIRLTEDNVDDRGRNAVYRIYRVYVFHRITDLWGDIPYSAAHDVINEENTPNFTPSYDTQESIYADMLNELNAAAEVLESTSTDMGIQDWLYGGDTESWRRFAHSLRLRLAMRISSVDPQKAMQVVNDLDIENDLITLPLYRADFQHSSEVRSPFYELHSTSQGMHNPAEFMIDLLNGHVDPRRSRFAEYSPQSEIFGTFEYVGVPSFVPSAAIDPNEQNDFTQSYIGDYFVDVNRPTVLLSEAEVHFLLAEAAMNGWVNGTAESHFENGVRAHNEQVGVEESEIEEYLNAAGAFDGSLEQLMTEKWKTFIYTDAVELYSEWRRTGFPILLNSEDQPVSLADIPRRLHYPQTEFDLNAQNVPAAAAVVWWDVN